MSTQVTIPGRPTIRALAFNESGVIEGTFSQTISSSSQIITVIFSFVINLTDNPLWWLIVIESDARRPGIAKVVEKWGDPDSSKSVAAASLTHGNVNRVCARPFFLPQKKGLLSRVTHTQSY